MPQYGDDTITFTHEDAPKILRPHEWVMIRDEFTAGDNIAVQNKLKLHADPKNKKESALSSLGDVALMTVQRMVKGWNITKTKRDGREIPVPFSTQNVHNLPAHVFTFINNEINKLNKADSEEEQEDFLSDASEPSEESSETESHRQTK